MAVEIPDRAVTKRFFEASETAGGLLLMAAAVLAMVVANSPLEELYHHTLHNPNGPVLSAKLGAMTPHLWINDGLMAVFFLLVGLEIKREFVEGRLATWPDRTMPAIAAVAGMAVPATVYLLVAGSDASLRSGWAIPAATDIAFALGVLALLGDRVPASLKLLLTSVAIVDDLCAVAIIGLFYTASLDLAALAGAVAVLAVMHILRVLGVKSLVPYLILALVLWYAVLLSGVHATIAGVLAATAIPLKARSQDAQDKDKLLHKLERALAPIVGLIIIPIFAFANAGVAIGGISLGALLAPLPLGIAAGLFVGKQVGVFGALRLSQWLGVARPLSGATMMQTYGVAVLCGVGFTMSLFIGALAFPYDPQLVEQAKIGVLTGSLLSALTSYMILRFASAPAEPQPRAWGQISR